MPGCSTASTALDFSILGRPFHATGAPRALAKWLRAHWDFPEHVIAPQGYTITLRVNDARPSTVGRATGTPVAVTVHGATLPWFSSGTAWWLDTPDGGLYLTLDPSSSHIDAWGAWDGDGTAALFLALYVALSESLRVSGLLPLHTAAAARDGAVTLFMGPSGTGKSTTVLRAALQGWTPLAEDMVWLDPETLWVTGWDRGVRLRPDTRNRFAGPLATLPWRSDADGKLVLDYHTFAAAPPRSSTLSRIIVLARDDRHAPGWEPMPPREMVRALWEATGVPLHTNARAWIARVIPDLISRVECRRLWIGNAPLPL